jgi:ketosteroid isomerase-like protein
MKKTRRIGALLADSLASYVQVPPEEAKIRAVRAESNRAIEARDLKGVAASLAEDFVVVVGDGTLLTRTQYLEAFEAGFDSPEPVRFERVVDRVDLSSTVRLAAEHGHWIGSTPDGRVLYTGTYMAMWRKTRAGWELRTELFVSLT